MILKCKLCKQRCHQTKSFGHSPSRQIWRPCSAHAPCPPPPRSPWLRPARGSWPGPATAPLRLSRRRAAPGAPRGPDGARAGSPGPGRGGRGLRRLRRRLFLRKPRSRVAAAPPAPRPGDAASLPSRRPCHLRSSRPAQGPGARTHRALSHRRGAARGSGKLPHLALGFRQDLKTQLSGDGGPTGRRGVGRRWGRLFS